MKLKLVRFLSGTFLILSTQTCLCADQTNTPPTINRDALREQLKNMTPEERRAKIQELREQAGKTNQLDLANRREELKKLTPEERQAKIKEWREKSQAPAQRLEKLNEQLADLRKKKTANAITPQEEDLLKRTEERVKIFEQQRSLQSTNQPPAEKSISSPEKSNQPK